MTKSILSRAVLRVKASISQELNENYTSTRKFVRVYGCIVLLLLLTCSILRCEERAVQPNRIIPIDLIGVVCLSSFTTKSIKVT